MAILDPSIIGHTSQQSDLLHAFTSGRLGNAYLFTGPSGVGKKLVAQGLAKALTCKTPLDQRKHGAPCHTCQHCLMNQRDEHPDVQLFQRESGKRIFEVSVMRERVLEWASLRSRAGGQKIGILNDVEALNPQAANAFLKTLEEPPERTLWILLTSDVAGTLSTILSRCRRVYFEPLGRTQLEQLADDALLPALREAIQLRNAQRDAAGIKDPNAPSDDEEDEDDAWGSDQPASGLETLVTPGERSFLLSIAQGSPGTLVRAMEEDLFLLRDWLVEFLLAPEHEGGIPAAELLLARLTRKGEENQEGLRSRLAFTISLAQSWMADACALLNGRKSLICNGDRRRQLERWSRTRDPRSLILVVDRLDELRAAISRNASPKLVASNLMLELAGTRFGSMSA